MRRMGVIPSYYLKYFYAHDKVVEQQRTERPRADVVSDVEEELLKVYADPQVVTKPEELEKRGGAYYSEAAVQLVHALTSGGPAEEHVVNVRNNGTMPFLPDDAVIEVPSLVDASGATPLPVRLVEPLYAGLAGVAGARSGGPAGEPPVRGAHGGVPGRSGLSPGGRDLLRGLGCQRLVGVAGDRKRHTRTAAGGHVRRDRRGRGL
jgi:hypothetical protein